jgi:class 3 adenylate cyclase
LQQIEAEKLRADELLHAILPPPVVEELKTTNQVTPRLHENVSVLFADVVDFTRYCETHSPKSVIGRLQELIEVCEWISEKHGLQKIKTIGDAYMAAAGLFKPTANPVAVSAAAALEIVAAARESSAQWELRIGIHIGPVIAGVVGRRRYSFDIWGDTVNTAQRIASHGAPGAVTLSRAAWNCVSDIYSGESLGNVTAKGKGRLKVVQITA